MKRPYSRRRPTSMVRRQSAEQRLDVDIGLLGQRKFQQRPGIESEQLGNDGIRELLDANVVDVGSIVVQLATVGDGILKGRDTSQQLHKALVGLEVGVAFGGRDNLPDAGPQSALRLSQCRQVLTF